MSRPPSKKVKFAKDNVDLEQKVVIDDDVSVMLRGDRTLYIEDTNADYVIIPEDSIVTLHAVMSRIIAQHFQPADVRRRQIQKALAKLTPEERKLLGLADPEEL